MLLNPKYEWMDFIKSVARRLQTPMKFAESLGRGLEIGRNNISLVQLWSVTSWCIQSRLSKFLLNCLVKCGSFSSEVSQLMFSPHFFQTLSLLESIWHRPTQGVTIGRRECLGTTLESVYYAVLYLFLFFIKCQMLPSKKTALAVRQICFLQPSFLSWSRTQPCICPHVLMHKTRINFYTFMGGGKNQWGKPQSSAVAYKAIRVQWMTVLLFYFPMFSLGSIFPNPIC